MLAAVVAALVIIGSLGSALPRSLFAPVQIDSPVYVSSDGNTTAVIDTESQRMVVLDADDRVVGVSRFNEINSPIDIATSVCVSGDAIFSFNTTLIWAVVVVALLGVLRKAAEAWKLIWFESAAGADVPPGWATGAMFAVRSLMLVVQPFVMGALLGASDSLAVVILGAFCVFCADAFWFRECRRT